MRSAAFSCPSSPPTPTWAPRPQGRHWGFSRVNGSSVAFWMSVSWSLPWEDRPAEGHLLRQGLFSGPHGAWLRFARRETL